MSMRVANGIGVLSAASILLLGVSSAALAQVRPNPPNPLLVEGGTAILPGTPLFSDGFEYPVGRTESTSSAGPRFLGAGWVGVKREPDETGANGWIYTTTAIPGYSGSMPGSGPRVLALEGRPVTEGVQTDYYLNLSTPGGGVGPIGTIPPNVWFRFWFYVNSFGAERSAFDDQNKFIYPSRASYPASEGTLIVWLIEHGRDAFEDLRPGRTPGVHVGPADHTYFSLRTYHGLGNRTPGVEIPTNSPKLYQNLDGSPLLPNTWYLITMHVDTSGPQGRVEMWRRPLGGTEVKFMDWHGGVTPNFDWAIPASHRDGHRQLRIPTTENARNGGEGDNYKYIDDFAMATSESDLPTY